MTCVYPGVVEAELANTISDPEAAVAMETYWQIVLKPDAIAHAIKQPEDIDTSDIVVRPTASR